MIIALTLKPKIRINLNEMAKWVSDLEGGKVETNIAQIKEVQRHVLHVLACHYRDNPKGVLDLLRRCDA